MTTQAWNELGILWKNQYMIIVIKYCIVMILLKRLELNTAFILGFQHWKHLTLSAQVLSE